MAEPGQDTLFDAQPTTPELYRAPDEPTPFGPITFSHKGTLGLVEFHRLDGRQPRDASTVTITLTSLGAERTIQYVGDLDEVCTGSIPNDNLICSLISEAFRRYANRVERGLEDDEPDGDDSRLTFIGYDSPHSDAERTRAQDNRGFDIFSGRLGTIMELVKQGRLRGDHAADAILRHALRLIEQYR